jgi:TonB-dependent starch-binding outer membrane protein SusC
MLKFLNLNYSKLASIHLQVFLILLFSIGANAQQIEIKGKVTDSERGDLFSDVSVTIQGTTKGTTTDFEGHYSISAGANDVLLFRIVGYQTQTIAVKNRPLINVVMKPIADLSIQNKVVTVGYVSQKKSQITGSVSSLSNKDFRDQPVSNVASSIQGKLAGLSVLEPSGTPAAGLLVSIRGNTNPLYVVDGIPLLSESLSSLSTAYDLTGKAIGTGQTLSSISDINPNDIESIEVLKDASAASIYGARAANGVILITTKRGIAGKTEVNFNYYTGVQKMARPISFMNSQQYRTLVEEARSNDLERYRANTNIFGIGFDPSILTKPLTGWNSSNNTNWLDQVTHVAPISNYEVSVRGGNEKTRYYLGAGYFNQEGIVIENYYKRLNFRSSLDQQLTDKITLGVNLSFSNSINKRSFNDDTYTGTIPNALGASPFMPVYESNGKYADFAKYESNWLSDSPVKTAKENGATTNNYRLLGSIFGEYLIAPNLKFRTSFSTDLMFLNDNQFKSPLTSDASAVGGIAYEGNYKNITWLNENILTYSKKTNKNTLNLLAGITEQEVQVERNSITGQGFPSGGLIKISSASQISNATSTGTGFGLISFLARANYDIAGRYLVTGSMRADASSRFPVGNRVGYFPSISAAWRLSEEAFFKKRFVSDLKLRMGFGITGDQEIGNYENKQFYTSSRYDGHSGLQLRNIADPNLSWQTNRSLNIGLDFELMGGVIYGSLEVFKSNKTNLLSEDLIAGTSGFPTVTRNSGEIENKGAELSLSALIMDRKDFRWSMSLNATYLKNTILSLSNDGQLLTPFTDIEATHILKVGESVGTFVGVKYLGVDSQTGDYKYDTKNADGNPSLSDQVVIGHALPDWFGGMTNNFKYQKFDLSIGLRFVAGNSVYNVYRATTESLGYNNGGGLNSVMANNTADVLNRWHKPGDVAEYGRASYVNRAAFPNSSQFLENGSFLRVQNLNLGYTFSGIKGFDNIRVYFEAQNLWVLTAYKGFDPEVSANGGLTDRTAGIDYGTYPKAHTFLIGANFKLSK